ncbi:MAG: hypothetical protein OEL66_09735 [Desulfobulbaceae bacterium]|nr:hypothetical protein [Desulfobulbaceae bacterium]
MEVEILLDLNEVDAKDHPAVAKRFQEWYAEGAEVRYDKSCFGNLSEVEPPTRYRVELGQVDTMTAIRDLHARLHRFGVKVFVHFLH